MDSRIRGNNGRRQALSFLRRQESINMGIRNEATPKSLFQRAHDSCKIMSLPLSIQNYQLAIINAKVPIHPMALRGAVILHC